MPPSAPDHGPIPPVTPVILTLNESANIARTLDAVRWARRVIVLDSGSTDDTALIAASYPNVSWFNRDFDCHAAQWNYAVRETNIDTDWVLALDADMIVSAEFVSEIRQHFLAQPYTAGIVPFRYRTGGRVLLGSLYPPDIRVFRPSDIRIDQAGHTQRFSVGGETYRFQSFILHDDRKPLDRWVKSQLIYSNLELTRMLSDNPSGLRFTLRRWGLSPIAAGLLGYVRAGGPLKGHASLQYAYERLTFESLLTLRLMRQRLAGADVEAEKP